ncbi:hypothetical protein K445DRAFT_23333 [Daldinia sp. EC12]|nr:hypothetical protein K445DRAFT_23333 [Daldinia sp. EC12]
MDNTNTTSPKRTLFKRRHLSTKSRIPLSNKSNLSTKATQKQHPLGPEWDHKDSSEGTPSSHASIPNATWVSEAGGSTKSSPRQVPGTPSLPATSAVVAGRPVTPPTTSCPAPIDPSSESPLSQIEAFETPFLYGHGTELAPIAEQRSIATLRSTAGGASSGSGTVSTSDISSLLKHKGSGTSVKSRRSRTESPPRRQLRRQPSFHFVDLPHLYIASTNTSNGDRPGSSKNGINPESSGTNDDAGVGTSTSSSNQSESGVRIPRLRNASKRHSPPAVETVDIHAYPQRPEYPPPDIRQPSDYKKIPLTIEQRDRYMRLEASLINNQTSQGGRPNVPVPQSQTPSRPRITRVCKACGRPLDQRWSLTSTIIGSGRGQRRGRDWCSRCAVRKIKRTLCCCNPPGFGPYPT